MKSIKFILAAMIFLSLLLPSCTIEKRVYIAGYNFNWTHNKHSPNKQEILGNSVEPSVAVKQANQELPIRDSNVDDPLITSTAKEQIILPAKKTITITAKSEKISTPYKNNIQNEVKEEPKMNGLALTGMILGISSIALAIIEGFAFVGVLGIIGIVCGILGIIFSAIAKRKIKKNPDKYKGKGFAITGLVCGIVGTAISILAVVLYFILINDPYYGY